MKITFLGTSSGVPTKQRNVTASAVSPDSTKRWYLLDCGEATQHQLLHTSLSLVHLEAIMITHVHGDHCYGLPGLLASAATYGRSQALSIIGPAAIKDYIEAVCRYTQLTLPYAINFHAVEALERPFTTTDYAIGRVPVSHRVPSFAYVLKERHPRVNMDAAKLRQHGIPPGPLWGRLQRGEDVVLDNGQRLVAEDYTRRAHARCIIIGGDNDSPQLLSESAEGIDLLVHEATYTAEVAQQVEPGPQHSSAESVAKFAERMQVPNLILTHFSKRYHRVDGDNVDVIRDEARRYYSGNLYLARDMEEYELSANGVVSLCLDS